MNLFDHAFALLRRAQHGCHADLYEAVADLQAQTARLGTQQLVIPHQLEAVLVAARAWATSYGSEDEDLQRVTEWALLEAVEELERAIAGC